MKRKKLIALGLSLMMITGTVLTGCGSKAEEGQADSGKEAGETEEIVFAFHMGKTVDLEPIEEKLNEILAANTGQPLERIAADTDRDNYMTAEEAKEYGLIDELVKSR